MSHQCPAPDCTITVPSDQFACLEHWFSIPLILRSELNLAYRLDPLGPRHIAAIDECQQFLEQG